MFRFVLFSIAAFLLFFPAAQAAPAFDIKVSSDTIHSAQIVTLTIEASWPASEGTYSFGIRGELPLDKLRIHTQGQSQETFIQNGETWTRKTFTFSLFPLEKGTGRIGSFFIPYLNAATETAPSQYEVKPITIKIVGRPLLSRITPGMLKIAGGAGFAAILIAAFAVFRKRKAPEPEPVDSAEASRANALTALQKPGISANEISSVFRVYLSETYPSLSSKLTEPELVRALDGLNLPGDETRSIKRLLESLTEAKYMGGAEGLNQIRKEIVSFIESKRVVGSPA